MLAIISEAVDYPRRGYRRELLRVIACEAWRLSRLFGCRRGRAEGSTRSARTCVEGWIAVFGRRSVVCLMPRSRGANAIAAASPISPAVGLSRDEQRNDVRDGRRQWKPGDNSNARNQ
jgi:hypothetical protein